MLRSSNSSYAIAIAATVSLLQTAPLQAHPHVWATVRDAIVIKNNMITGVRHEWLFDENYSASAIESLDANGDGKLDRSELEGLAKTNIDGLKEFDYFTSASIARLTILFGEPQDYWLDFDRDRLSLHFFLPLKKPIAISTPHVRISVDDPSYFIAFSFAEVDPVRFSDDAPAGCKAILARPGENAASSPAVTSQSSQVLSSEDGNTIEISCPSKTAPTK